MQQKLIDILYGNITSVYGEKMPRSGQTQKELYHLDIERISIVHLMQLPRAYFKRLMYIFSEPIRKKYRGPIFSDKWSERLYILPK